MRPRNIFSQTGPKINKNDIERFAAKNPELWKEMKKQYDIGRKIVTVQLLNGLDRSNEKILRDYLKDYARRYLSMGTGAFPISFNVLELFFTYNFKNSILQLVEEEESYELSLYDFLDFITNKDFDLNKIDFYDNIPEKVIHHYSFNSGFDEINFSNDKERPFYISGLSLIRQGNEVSMLMQAGESYDREKAEEYFKDKTVESIKESIRPEKKELRRHLEETHETPKVVHLDGRDDLWLHSVAVLFDLETKSIDIRHVARDENLSYHLFSDDFFSLLAGQDDFTEQEAIDYFKSHLKELESYDAVFDFAKYCLALPYYTFENEDKIVDVNYETGLNTLIKGPISKRDFSLVPSKYKLFAKPLYYIESNTQKIVKSQRLGDTNFKVEQSGFWKRLEREEEGFDKKGRSILGKTWVERSDVFHSYTKGVTKIDEVKLFNEKNAGYIYIMRQPAHPKNTFKIGLTTRNTQERSKELSNTSVIDELFVLTEFHTKDCFLAEKLIHQELDSYRLSTRREFFRCDLRIVIDICEKIIKEINR